MSFQRSIGYPEKSQNLGSRITISCRSWTAWTKSRPPCSRTVTAINAFLEEFNPSGLVVCCRLNEYRWLPERLKLNGAICLEPLSKDEVDQYLARSGPKLATL